MMEKPHVRKRHGHAVFIAALDDRVITDGSAGLCDILHAALVSAFNVVAEGEEGIGTQGHVLPGVQESALLRVGQGSGLFSEILLPIAVRADIFLVLVDVAVNDIVPFGPAQIRAEGQVQDLLMLAQEPGVRLVVFVTISESSSRLISKLLRPCSKVMPKTCLRSCTSGT